MKFFVSTGEVSGDLHLSYLVKAMLEKNKDMKFYGAAGNHSRAQGVEVIQDIEELAIMGFTEVFKKYSFLKKKANEYIDFIKKEKIDKVILVDYGGFNLKFLELLKKEAPEVEVFYYIPPKLWIWGEKRITKLVKADHIMVIFPWEVDFYKKHGVDAVYFGNPFVDKYSVIERTGNNILLLPGSRKQEIRTLIPIMLKVVEKKKDETFLLKLSSSDHLKWIDEDLNKYKNLKIVSDKSLAECVKESKTAVAASGTVTLELALMGIPVIVVYRTNFINAFIARHILKVGFVSLPNLTLNREVYPELLQEKCNPEEIEKYLDYFENSKEKIAEDIAEVRKKLSGKDVVKSYGNFLIRGEQ